MICRTDRIGDVILTLPVTDVLRETFPKAVIDMLVQSRVHGLIEDYHAIDNVIKIDEVTVSGISKLCREGNYDLAIAVYPEFSLALGLKLGGVKHRLGTGYRWYSFLFNLKHYQHRKEALKHESRYNLDLLEVLNIFYNKELKPNIKVSDEYMFKAIEKITKANPGKILNASDTYIVIHIPTLGSAKVWRNENFSFLINLLLQNNADYKIIFTGTEEEIQQILQVIDNYIENNMILIALNLTLKELAALLNRAKLFLGNSTGPVHIAAAVGTFVVGLYSPVKVESPVRWGPLTENKKIFVPPKDDDSRDVMNDIKPEEVHNFIINYMESSIK